MLNASDALRAHLSCKALIAQCLQQPPHCMDYFDFKPHHDCPLMQFVRECEQDHGDWLEIGIVKSAHQNFHALTMDMAQKKLGMEPLDIDAELSPSSDWSNASATLIASVWRLERRLHSMAD